MKKNILLLSAIIALSANAQTPLDLTPPVKKVTVYLSGAILTHEVQASLPEGKTTVVFHGLPSYIDKESIQLSSTGDITILSVTAYEDYLSESKKNVKTKKWSDSVNVLNDEMERLRNEITIMEAGKSLLDNNRNTAGANNGTNAATVKAMYDFYVHQVAHIDDSLMMMRKKERYIQGRLNKINSEMMEWRSRTDTLATDVEAIVTSDHAQNLSFRLAYLTYSAGWSPIYDLRAKDIKHNCELTYKASVYQHTGDDWNNVDLTLSTSNPQVSQTAPFLNPWYLSFQQNYSYGGGNGRYRSSAYGGAPAPMAQKAEMEDHLALNEVTVSDSKAVYNTSTVSSTTNESQLAVEFHIDVPYTLPTDGKTHTVDIKKIDLPALYRNQTTPKLNQNAFLMADVIHWQTLDLLPGEVNIYYAGAYVGKSYINAQSTTDTISFSLGMDKKIVVKRERVSELCSTKWIGTNKTQVYAYSITLRNTHSDSTKIEVFDQVPVTTDKDIVIEVLDKNGASQNTDTGKLTWHISLAPGETRKLTFSYSVKYPKDKIVQNL
ncbi:MAG TPA: DUF4139 domain-containing protein [Bacteroidia bacterium]|jgi:uncharacterized protein (TIGR02231 family)|nr:DUF4139 domain-containing protein [Bacteroidia bacterium]